jgi:hypothetical protein
MKKKGVFERIAPIFNGILVKKMISTQQWLINNVNFSFSSHQNSLSSLQNVWKKGSIRISTFNHELCSLYHFLASTNHY